MSPFVEQVDRKIRERQLLGQGDRVVVAVSGGLDSMVLLRVLHELAEVRSWRLCVAHYNHRLRGEESDGDEAFVGRVARRRGLEFVSGAGDIRQIAEGDGISIETAARRSRHAFLARAARDRGEARVALAHQEDDQVETFLLRLFRGSGSDGLRAMRPVGRSPGDSEVTLVRPFLEIPRRELEAFARTHRIRFREDRSNRSPRMQRNLLRRRIIPLIRDKIQPALSQVVVRTIEVLREEVELLDEQAARWLESASTPFPGLHPALQRRVVRRQLEDLGIPAEFDLVELLRLNEKRRTMPVEGVQVWRERSGRLARGSIRGRLKFRSGHETCCLEGRRGVLRYDGLRIEWRVDPVGRGSGVVRKPKGPVEVLDADAVGRRIVLRHWQPGDRFQPLGMGGPMKVQDFLTNEKVVADRRRYLVFAVAENGGMFWIEDLRISECYKVKAATRSRLRWRWSREA